MGREKRLCGSSGEAIASDFLKKKGYRIIAKNLRTPFGEIDIVTRHAGLTVFVEVKTRTTSSLGPPYISITGKKIRHIIKNSAFYMRRHNLSDSQWRVDIVSVKLNRDYKPEKIELIENAIEEN